MTTSVQLGAYVWTIVAILALYINTMDLKINSQDVLKV